MGRSEHGHWKRTKGARGAYDVLRAAETDRLPHLIPVKYERMIASPFGYFRGAVAVMAHDIGREPNTGIYCQLCGDAHVRNLGAYAAPDGRPVFDINDFDETIAGPFEWDVKRMATSIHVATREINQRERDCCEAVRVFLHRYAKSMEMFAAMPILEIARYQIHRQTELETMQSVFAKAERSTPLHLRDALTRRARSEDSAGGKKAKKKPKEANEQSAPAVRVFRSEPPDLERLSKVEAGRVLDALAPYMHTLQPERRHLLSRYRPVDTAFKIVGTGSVGLRDYVIYLEGNGPEDPLFLQIKQEVASAWAPYAKVSGKEKVSQGRRVVNGQRAMQVQSDPFLGYTQMDGRDYLVRQLNDHKGSVNLGTLDLASVLHFADLCGELLARGHVRSGNPHALAGYIGGGKRFEKAIAEFASRYADQTEADWKELKKLAGNGTLRGAAR